MANSTALPVYLCDCGRRIEFPGRRIGDILDCPGCGATRVIIRSKIDGPMPEASALVRNLTTAEREEVARAHENIRRRRERSKNRRGPLYPVRWVFLLGLLGVYAGGALACRNLENLGKPERGRRLLWLAAGSYLLVFLGIAIGLWKELVTPGVLATVGFAYTFAGALLVANAVRRETALGFASGAKPAPILLPGLFTIIVLVVQFAIGRALVTSSGF